MDLIDMSWEKKCREEDMKQRVIENTRRAIDDARRSVDEKAQQLKTLAHQSALIAGFSMVVLVEITIPDDLNPILLVAFGCTTAGVVSLMLTAMLTSTYILVAILRYDCVTREIPFLDFWRRRCEGDWKFALKAFTYGIPLFMMVLAEVGWVIFWGNWKASGIAAVYASACVSIIAVLTVIIYLLHTDRKWRDWLLTSNKIQNPEA